MTLAFSDMPEAKFEALPPAPCTHEAILLQGREKVDVVNPIEGYISLFVFHIGKC